MGFSRLFALAAVLVPASAHAWEVSTTESGDLIRWAPGEVVIDLSLGAKGVGVSESAARRESEAAFRTWEEGLEGELQVVFAPQEDDLLPRKRDGLNVVRWATSPDEDLDPSALAVTYLTYRSGTGEALEADIVLNAVNHSWSANAERCRDGAYDIQNVLAHEVGHLVGLGHSADEEESTMFPSAVSCETKKRSLEKDDLDGANFLYGDETSAIPAPAAGPLAGCSASGDSKSDSWCFLLAAAIFLVAFRRTRRHVPFVAAAVGLVAIPSAHASTSFYLESAELVGAASMVVEGRVVDTEVISVDGSPVTLSKIVVSACHTSVCDKEVIVQQPGGEINGEGLIVSGIHHMKRDSDVLVFLRPTSLGYKAVGGNQGIFMVQGPKSQQRLVRDLRGTGFLTRDGKKAGTIETFLRADFDRTMRPLLEKKLR